MGLVSGSSALEASGNWTSDVEYNGIENTSPIKDLSFGMLSGLTELVGGEGRLLDTFFKQPFKKEVSKEAERGIARALAKGAANVVAGAVPEGLQEAGQEILSILNEYTQGRNVDTVGATDRIIDSFLKGMVGGTVFSSAGEVFKQFKAEGAAMATLITQIVYLQIDRGVINRNRIETISFSVIIILAGLPLILS